MKLLVIAVFLFPFTLFCEESEMRDSSPFVRKLMVEHLNKINENSFLVVDGNPVVLSVSLFPSIEPSVPRTFFFLQKEEGWGGRLVTESGIDQYFDISDQERKQFSSYVDVLLKSSNVKREVPFQHLGGTVVLICLLGSNGSPMFFSRQFPMSSDVDREQYECILDIITAVDAVIISRMGFTTVK